MELSVRGLGYNFATLPINFCNNAVQQYITDPRLDPILYSASQTFIPGGKAKLLVVSSDGFFGVCVTYK